MAAIVQENRSFKKAIILSVSAHLVLFIIILISPFLPKPSRRGMVHYVNVISLGGGGGAGSASESMIETDVLQRETLRDLTTPQKLQQEAPPSMTYPVEKPKRERKPKTEKKVSIQKSKPPTTKQTSSQTGGGTSSGIRIGVGSGTSGGGFGSEYSSQIGLSTFPFTYYLQTIHGRISNNWYTSQIKTGITGSLHTTILFRISRDGQITEPEIIESSRNRTMDLSAIRAVRSASPFPPLPNEYEDDYLIIRLIFEHSK